MQEAKLLHLLRSKSNRDSMLAKPDKVSLHHPNLFYAIGGATLNKGNERETFFYNQVNNAYKINYTPQGDFLVAGKYTFEIGGKTKSKKQIKAVKNSYIAADMLEYGYDNKIPLWLFGFLY